MASAEMDIVFTEKTSSVVPVPEKCTTLIPPPVSMQAENIDGAALKKNTGEPLKNERMRVRRVADGGLA